jgi:hypothetical protein
MAAWMIDDDSSVAADVCNQCPAERHGDNRRHFKPMMSDRFGRQWAA